MRPLPAAAVGAAGLAAYGLVEPHLYRLTTHLLPVPGERPPLDVLHLSDTHFGRRHRRLASFLRRVPEMLGAPPDVVVATGDLIEGNGGIAELVACLERIEARLGRFYVLGSHDYFRPKFENYTKYFTGRRDQIKPEPAATGRLEEGLRAAGWLPLTNATETVEAPFGRVRVTGVDDPYIRRHRTGHLSARSDDVYRVGLVHAPDVVSEFVLAGFDLVAAGHTHGGQVRVPGLGAVVTNSSLPAALAAGPTRIGGAWLHASPGLGTGRFAPVRLFCPPEVTLLRLVPAR